MPKTKEEFFVETNFTGESRIEVSPSGKYSLLIKKYKTEEGAWQFSRGVIQDKKTEKLIADVKRNYSAFPFGWIENHPDGHDYLFCGEDYQGQTIIQLDTGERLDFLPESAQQGRGFCMTNYYPNSSKTILAIEGCYWAAPWQVKFYDFTDPMKWDQKTPFKDPPTEYSDFFGWIDEETAHIGDTITMFLLPEELTAEDIERIPNKKYSVKVHEIDGKLYIDDWAAFELLELEHDNTITEEIYNDESREVEIPTKVVWNIRKNELIL